jgi:hypothetical protein
MHSDAVLPAPTDISLTRCGDQLRSTDAQIEFLLRRALAEAGPLPGNARQMRRPRRGRGPPHPGSLRVQTGQHHSLGVRARAQGNSG